MTDLDGKDFRRTSDVAGSRFYWIGDQSVVRNIPFRICANTTNCDLSQDEPVPELGKWYLQDQIGFEDKPTADFVGTEKGVNNDFYLTNTASVAKPNQAATTYSLTAKLKCLFGKCAPCARFEFKGILPWVQPGSSKVEALRVVNNIDSCFPIIFQETGCVKRP